MLHLGHRDGFVLDAEVADAAGAAPQVRDEGVVGVQHEPRLGFKRGDHRSPPVGDRLELAVAVELVAKQVAEHQRSRRQLADHPVQPELVELEQTKLAVDPVAAASGGQQRGCHASGHVRAGAVVDKRDPGSLKDRGGHRGGCGLAVGRGDHDRAARQPRRELADRTWLQPHQHHARQARAATAGPPGHASDRPGRCDFHAQQAHPGTITRTAR